MEATVRAGGASPATIAVLKGEVKVGLSDAELEHLAQAKGVMKVSRRDYPVAVAQKCDGGHDRGRHHDRRALGGH